MALSQLTFRNDMYFAWGVHPVLERLMAQPETIEKILLAREFKAGNKALVLDLARRHSIPLEFHPPETLDKVSAHAKHQGIVALVKPGSVKMLGDLLSRPVLSRYGLILILDGIVDPQNLGSLIRSGHAAGIQGIIIPKHRAAGLSGTVEKASAGALAHVPVLTVTNLVSTIKELKNSGYWIAGAEAESGRSIYETDFRANIALVIGSEAKGIRPLVKQNCDLLVSIPMFGKVSSLNAAIAGAVILFEIARQRTLIPNPV